MNQEDIQNLIELAKTIRKNAQAKYSNFKVGAVVKMSDGSIYSGANVESSSYGLSICAERVALTQAVVSTSVSIDIIVVVADSNVPVPPCGACRQLMIDYAPLAKVIYANLQGEFIESTVKALLPNAFTEQILTNKTK